MDAETPAAAGNDHVVSQTTAPRSSAVLSMLLGVAGGAIGGVVGWFLFFAIVKQGFYAIVLPGAHISARFLSMTPITPRRIFS